MANLPNPSTSLMQLDGVARLPTFQYSALSSSTSVRLVHILPSHPGVIRCEVTSIDIGNENKPHDSSFVALSYTWGSPITIHEDPVSFPDAAGDSNWSPELPFVFPTIGVGETRLFNIDFAMKYYVERHPGVPRRKTPESKEERKLIEINGCSLHVQQNLYDFLQDFRSATFESSRGSASQDDEEEHSLKSPPIWIDAICINQDDLQERASQVLLMGRIFRSASRVLAWLGPPDSFTEDAIHGLDTLFHSNLGLDPGNVTMESFPGIDLIHWVAIFAFFQRSWFRRAWVTQEVAFGRERLAIIHGGYMRTWHWLTIVCVTLENSGLRSKISKLGYSLLTSAPLSDGNRRLRVLVQYHDDLRANSLSNTSECLDEGQDGVAFISSVRAVLWRLRENGNDLLAAFPPLLRVLQLFRGTQATDPRDKVFAFLNLALDQRELGLVPDYHASVQSVFRNTTEMIMKTTKSLSILSHVQEHGDTRIEHLPGWVPDFSAWLRYTPLDTGDDDVVYCASGPGTEACFEVLDDGTLRIESIRVDQVITCLRLDGDSDDTVHSVLKAVLRVPHWYPVDNFKDELENFNDDTWWNFPTEEIKWTGNSETKDEISDEHDGTDEGTEEEYSRLSPPILLTQMSLKYSEHPLSCQGKRLND
ncbi:hypothetical protein MRS44_013734 [Fusarium solani]|uniref:uncharacterized protein n=1 Tax=Fusarium solani TaxID=169388 RepID=UPI0032C428E7|nr:hypothetical protein MRS44_013734 [Fusarium solani]